MTTTSLDDWFRYEQPDGPTTTPGTGWSGVTGDNERGAMDTKQLEARLREMAAFATSLPAGFRGLTDQDRDDLRAAADALAALREDRERLTVRFTCPLCGIVNEPTRGQIVMDKPYRCDECMTALVFSVRSPELDAIHDEVLSEEGPQW